MISYYELLGMIKEDKAPNKIRVHLTSKPKIYKAVYDFGDFNYYTLYEKEIIDDDYHHYLAECFLESSMFEKNIEIIEEKKKIPEKLKDILRVDDLIPPVDENMYKIWEQTIKNQNKINEICDYLKSKEE